MFNKKSSWDIDKWNNSNACRILWSFTLIDWINEDRMTKQEKTDHPEAKVQSGYLRKYDYKEAWQNLWKKLSDADKKEIYKLPNFSWKVFTEITGIKKEAL